MINRLGYAQITEEPVDVEQRAPVRVAYARDGAVRVGPHERDGAYGWRRREGACGTSVAAERRVQLAPAVRMCGEKGVENRGRVELCAGREVEIVKERVKRKSARLVVRVVVYVAWHYEWNVSQRKRGQRFGQRVT